MNDDSAELAALVRGARKTLKLTQQQVHERAKVTRSTISAIENGNRLPKRSDSRDGLVRLAQVLQLQPQRVLELAGHEPRSDVRQVRTRPDLEEFILTEPSLTADQRGALVSLVRLFREGP